MKGTKQPYETPSMRPSGNVVEVTLIKTTGIAEASSPMLPKNGAGDLGFGL